MTRWQCLPCQPSTARTSVPQLVCDTGFASSHLPLPLTTKQMLFFRERPERNESSDTAKKAVQALLDLFAPALIDSVPFSQPCLRAVVLDMPSAGGLGPRPLPGPQASPVPAALLSRHSKQPGARTAGEFCSLYSYMHVNIKVKTEGRS